MDVRLGVDGQSTARGRAQWVQEQTFRFVLCLDGRGD
jgi:hypothetical protein